MFNSDSIEKETEQQQEDNEQETTNEEENKQQTKRSFSDIVKEKISKNPFKKKTMQTSINNQQNNNTEETKHGGKISSMFEDPKKVKTCLYIAIVLIIVCIIGFIIYVIVSNKQTQQIILCKNSEIESCNNKIDKMKKEYKESVDELQTENNNLKQHLMAIHTPPEDDEEIEEFKQDSRPIEIEQPTRITYTRYQETKQIQQPIKQDDKKVVEIEEQEEPKEEPKEKQIINEEENTIKITEDDNEYVANIPQFEDAPKETEGIQKKKMTQQQMIKKALNNKCIDMNNRKQQAIALQQKQKDEELENYAKEEQKIATELGLNRNQDINEEEIKKLIKEEDLKDETNNEQPFEDAGMLDQSLILGAH